MADEGAVAVAESPVVDAGVDAGAEDLAVDGGSEAEAQPDGGDPSLRQDDKTDGRRQPDGLKKYIADLRRQADLIQDPKAKADAMAQIKELNNRSGKNAAYEGVYPTVREARETKALVESFGGREGLATLQGKMASVEQIDRELSEGNPAVIEKMWKDAPEGMTKLAPAIFSELEKANPQEYAKAVVPHAIKFFDSSGFPEAFDHMVNLFSEGKKAEGDVLAQRLAQWFNSQRQAPGKEEKQVDPNVERLQKELDERKANDTKQAVDRAYSDVVAHAVPVIDKHLKLIVKNLGLNQRQYESLREHAWQRLQDTRNADPTYKTVANAKYARDINEATTYIKGETETRAEDAARWAANDRYEHQLKNGAVKPKSDATATPLTPNVQRGKEPSPAEIDYGPKGIAAAKKAGFKDIGDMILSGKAPLKVGGIRQWR